MPRISELVEDLRAEHLALDQIVAALPDPEWDRSTPAEPWSIRDQVSHLRFFDEQARIAVADPERFAAALEQIAADPQAVMDGPLIHDRELAPLAVLADWRKARAGMLDVLREIDPDARIPWFGPSMGPASFISARLMETWAHGQDVADALGVDREPTDRLHAVCHLGVLARPFSYSANRRPVPATPVRVELEAPSGGRWEWGPSEAPDRVRGGALDFALVVTQRRHPADTSLVTEGPIAEEWIEIAQCFAGPPGKGRRPGQFPRSDR